MLCFTILVDLKTGQRLSCAEHSHLVCCEDEDDDRTDVVRVHTLASFIPYVKYRVTDLNGLWVEDNRMALRFKDPRHQLMVQTEDHFVLRTFVFELTNRTRARRLYIELDGDYDPDFDAYASPPPVDRFLANAVGHLDVRCLSTLVLENCRLPSLPVSDLAINHISLNGSTLGTTRREREYFWDWMTADSVRGSLLVLEMNGCSLAKVPFEIIHLKKLRALSMAKNNLKYLPLYITELKNIRCLFVNDNQLEFLPGCFQDITFEFINLKNNNFNMDLKPLVLYDRTVKRKAGKKPCVSLFHLSLFALLENCIFKRRNIPRSLWPIIDGISRCQFCCKWVAPQYTIENYNLSYIKSHNLIENRCTPWQFFDCGYKCSPKLNYVDLEFKLL